MNRPVIVASVRGEIVRIAARRYSEEFQRDAVEPVASTGRSVNTRSFVAYETGQPAHVKPWPAPSHPHPQVAFMQHPCSCYLSGLQRPLRQ